MPRRIQIASALLLLLLVALFSMTPMTATQAQTGPTPTPNDPLWRAFSSTRDALEEKFNTDLTIVQNWTFEEMEFVNGIDDCVQLDDPNSARSLYFGWRFVITSLSGRQFEGRSSFDATIITACDTVTEASAPQATAAPGAGLPAPVAGAGATGSFEIGGHILEMSTGTINAARRAGMTWVKIQTRHAVGADPSGLAGVINNAHSNGFKILLGIVGDKNQIASNFDSYIQSYASYVAGVAALGADAIEVWNEPNLVHEWPAGQINGANYTRLLAAAFNAIKSRSSATMVISAAPSPTGYFAGGCASDGCNDDVFMQQMAAAGAGNYMDCVGLHYNEGIIAPSQTSGDPRGGYPTYYFQSMLSRGLSPFGGKPACWTELGYLSPQGFSTPLPGNFAWGQNTTVAQQASWLADAAARSAQSGRVRLMIVWNVDFTLFTATDPQGGYAMLRPDGSCPACDALGTVMRR